MLIRVIFLSIFPFVGFCQREWNLVKEESPLKVYTRLKEGSPHLETKVVGKAKADIGAILAVMQDPDNFTAFMPNCIESSKIVMKGDTCQIHRVLIDAPWPVLDREGFYEFNYNYIPDSNQVFVNFKALTEAYKKTSKDHVMVTDARGHLKLVQLPDNEVSVEYVIYANPGGRIPYWLSNMSVVDLPLGTINGAFHRSKLPQYQGKEFSFLE